jgi:hypothetical protein
VYDATYGYCIWYCRKQRTAEVGADYEPLEDLRWCIPSYSRAVAGTFKVDSFLPSSIYAVTSQNDQLYSQTSINPNTFGPASPSTQTGVVVHEWFHTTQIDDNPFFTFRNGWSRKMPSWLGGGRAWFSDNLEKPTSFGRDKLRLGICWFKAGSPEHISRIWEMVRILERNGIYVRKIRTDKPGYVTYEDEWQLVAEPFRKGTLPGR